MMTSRFHWSVDMQGEPVQSQWRHLRRAERRHDRKYHDEPGWGVGLDLRGACYTSEEGCINSRQRLFRLLGGNVWAPNWPISEQTRTLRHLHRGDHWWRSSNSTPRLGDYRRTKYSSICHAFIMPNILWEAGSWTNAAQQTAPYCAHQLIQLYLDHACGSQSPFFRTNDASCIPNMNDYTVIETRESR